MAAKPKPGVPPPAHTTYSAHQKFLGAATQVPIAGLTAKDITDQGLVSLNPSDPKSDLVKVTPSGPQTHDRPAVNAVAGPGPAPTPAPVATSNIKGWTGALIAPDQRVHAAAALAIDHVGNTDAQAAATNPAHPEHPAHQAFLTGQVLNDPRLGSRSVGSVNAPPGVPVGSASTFANAGIPATIASAVQNFNTNTASNPMGQFLSQIFGTGAGSGGSAASSVPGSSSAQDDYFRSQTALNNQRFQTNAAPGLIQSQINNNLAANPAPMGVMSLNPAMPGSYNGTQDAALQSLYGQQANAKQAVSGWTAPTY